MKSWYKKSQADLGNLRENEYIADVKVRLNHRNKAETKEIDIDDNVVFKYHIDISQASYGITNINVSFFAPVQIPATLYDIDIDGDPVSPQFINLVLDTSKLNVEKVISNVIMPFRINLSLNDNFEIDYSGSEIEVGVIDLL